MADTTTAAAIAASVSFDDIAVLQVASTRLLVAAALGKIDLNALARTELASRGIGTEGRWVGFNRATKDWR